MPGAIVYIVKCADGSYYTGLTKQKDVKTRVQEHNDKVFPNSYTSTRLPVTLAYAENFDLVLDAINAERRIKGWSRAKKEAMIAGDWEALINLSKRRGGKPAL